VTIIANIDGATRRVFLHQDTVGTSLHPIDIYHEMRSLRASDETLRYWDLYMKADGNVSKGGGKFTERYVTLLDGTRIVPYDSSQNLTITGTIITDDGQEGPAAFDKSLLSPTTSVDITYVPPQVEVIEVLIAGGLSPEQATMLSELWKIAGLDVDNPLTISQVSKVVDTVNLLFSGDGENNLTVTRQ